MRTTVKTNFKPSANLDSIYTVKKLIESLGGMDKIGSIKLKGALKEIEACTDISVLTLKRNVCYSHKAKELSKLNKYAKAIVCAINLDNRDHNTNKDKDKIHIIKSALLVEKLIKDNNFTDKKNKFDLGLLKDIIGKYIDTETLNFYSNKANELIEINFLQFNAPVLNSLEILRSKDSDKALVDCQLRINVTDVSIFKEFDNSDDALQYVRVFLLDDIKQQQNLNQISKNSPGIVNRRQMR